VDGKARRKTAPVRLPVPARRGCVGLGAGQLATVGTGVTAGDVQTKAGAPTVGGSGVIQPDQPLENAFPVSGRDAGTGVRDIRHGLAPLHFQSHQDPATRTGGVQRVVEEIADDRGDLAGVDRDDHLPPRTA